LAVIPDPDPGRNDDKSEFPTFYEAVKIAPGLKDSVSTPELLDDILNETEIVVECSILGVCFFHAIL